MVPKGCQLTIPYGLIDTPWKVLVDYNHSPTVYQCNLQCKLTWFWQPPKISETITLTGNAFGHLQI